MATPGVSPTNENSTNINWEMLFDEKLWRSDFMQPLRAKAIAELGGEGWLSYMGDWGVFEEFVNEYAPDFVIPKAILDMQQ